MSPIKWGCRLNQACVMASQTSTGSRSCSPAIWIFLTGILTVRIVSCFSVGEDAGDIRLVKGCLRLATLGACLGLLALGSLVGKRSTGIHLRNPGILLGYAGFLGIAGISILYSSSAGFSALQFLMYGESLCFAVAYYRLILLTGARDRLPSILVAAVGIVALGMLAGASFHPELFYRQTHGGDISRLGGFLMNPNELGLLMTIGLGTALLAGGGCGSGWKRGTVFLIGSAMLAALGLTMSRSSWSALGILVVFALGMERSSVRRALLLGGSVVTGVFGCAFLKDILFRTDGGAELSTLTDRVPFWRDLLFIAFPERPATGFGFQRIWSEEMFFSPNSYSGSMAHNTFLQTLLGLGVVGLAVALGQLGWTIGTATRLRGTRTGRVAFSLLIPLLVNSLTEFGIFGPMNFGVLFYQLVLLMLSMDLVEPPSLSPRSVATPGTRVAHGTA